MKFCKTCDKKLAKDEKRDECFKCQYTQEKENFSCDFMDDEGLTCIYQYNMFRHGNVMDCEGNWLTAEEAKKYPRPEELHTHVDWLHIHCSGGCIEYFKHVEPTEYLSMIKQFKSKSEYISECKKIAKKLTPKLIKVVDEQGEELILEFDEKLECEICAGDKVTRGSYKVSGDTVEIGFCMPHVIKEYNTWEEVK